MYSDYNVIIPNSINIKSADATMFNMKTYTAVRKFDSIVVVQI